MSDANPIAMISFPRLNDNYHFRDLVLTPVATPPARIRIHFKYNVNLPKRFILNATWMQYEVTIDGDKGQLGNIRKRYKPIMRFLLREATINIVHRQGTPTDIKTAITEAEDTNTFHFQNSHQTNNIRHIEVTLRAKRWIKSYAILPATVDFLLGAILIKKDYLVIKIASAVISFLGISLVALLTYWGLN
ncbi:hypothetical protein TWF192_011396 [Orbilia oligospora]|uniref:Uncharacterized protein n=1 Tax=Orbilia oligospora TaxID=2813651 RepID=A0A6G1LYP2_ORBOL|nr:hypothetical protein TWF679_010501 [Orbilia oligospora]KAF3231687.1 hypothetical protein TWF191_005747 [Orbilia oligospora]KAF3236562.1 hypothetical protein TWF192_011396 [Orbilia oligospora]